MEKRLVRAQLIISLMVISNSTFALNNIYFGYKPILIKYTMVNKIDEDATTLGSGHAFNFGGQLIFGYDLSTSFSFETGIGTSKSESSFFPGNYGTLESYDGLIYRMRYIDIPTMLKYHTAYKNRFVIYTGLGLLYKNINKADIYQYSNLILSKKDFSADGYQTIDRYNRNNFGLVYELGFDFPIASRKLILGFSYQYQYIFNDIEDKEQRDKNGVLVWNTPHTETSHGTTKLKGYGFAASLIYNFWR